jgi:oligopeptide transport system substrate-binding protein
MGGLSIWGGQALAATLRRRTLAPHEAGRGRGAWGRIAPNTNPAMASNMFIQKGGSMSRIRLRVLAVAAAAGMVALSCGGNNSGGGGETLAADQTLSFPIQDDIATLDPGHTSSGVDITFVQNVFSGLYKFDSTLKVVPDIATAAPDISSDGKTYTFKLRKDVKFSNGDPVKASDFLYSWNRTARLNDAYATVFDPVVGGLDVEGGKAQTMSGLSAPDDYTIKAQLTDPSGAWLTELAIWSAAVVDQKVIQTAGEDTWWTKPETLIGAGPFKMTARSPKASMEFAPVSGWWGGSTGALKDIKVQIGIDQASAVKKLESGGLSLIGMANEKPSPDDVLRYKSDPIKSKMLTIYPGARTSWLGFNFDKGPFAPKSGTTPGQPTSGLGSDAGKDGRMAFSQSIDRDQLVDVACVKGATCTKATGGFISKGLKGYLGDNQDPSSKFDSAAAKSNYQKWDPDGSKVKGLQLRYNTTAVNTQLFSNVQSQIKSNLNVNVELAPSDFPTLINDRKAKNSILFRDSWGADYDHPQDWFGNIFTCAQAAPGKQNNSGYCNPTMDKVLAKADTEQITQAEPEYKQAQKLMIADYNGGALTYDTQSYITQTYVKGAGFNSLYDYSWTGIRILKH